MRYMGWSDYVVVAMVVIGCVLTAHILFLNPAVSSHFAKLDEIGTLFAVIAAITANIFYARQAMFAQEQLKIAQGDGAPTLDIVGHLKKSDELVVQVINWNRRTILVHDISIVKPRLDAMVWKAGSDDGDYWGRSPVFRPPLRINGYERRNEVAPRKRITLLGANPSTGQPVENWSFDVEVAVSVELIDEKHTRMVLKASLQSAKN